MKISSNAKGFTKGHSSTRREKSVEQISNGFILTESYYDKKGEYMEKKTYFKTDPFKK